MALRIQNNVEAFNAHRNLTGTSNMLATSMERLSSGFRINSRSVSSKFAFVIGIIAWETGEG